MAFDLVSYGFFFRFRDGRHCARFPVYRGGRQGKGKLLRSAGAYLTLASLFGTAVLAIGVIFSPLLAGFITKDPATVKAASVYLRIIFLGMPFIFVTSVFDMLFSAEGDTVTPMYVNFITVVLNIFLDPLLIFGLWGFPKMGIAGAAVATVICRGIATVISLYILFSGKKGIKIDAGSLVPDFQ